MDLCDRKVLAFGTDWEVGGNELNPINQMITSTLSMLGIPVYSTVPYFEEYIPASIKSNAEGCKVHLIGCKKRTGRKEVPDKAWIMKYPRQYYKDSVWPNGKKGNFSHIIAYFPDTFHSGIDLKQEYLKLGLQVELIVIVCRLQDNGLSKEDIDLFKRADKIFSIGPMNFRMCTLPKQCFHRILLPLHSFLEHGNDNADSVMSIGGNMITILTVWPSYLSNTAAFCGSFKYGLQIIAGAIGKTYAEHFDQVKGKQLRWIFLGVPDDIKEQLKNVIIESSKCTKLDIVLETACDTFRTYLSLASLYVSPFLYEPFDMFCVQGLLNSIPTLLYSTSGLGEYLGQRENITSLYLLDCSEDYEKDVESCFQVVSGKISTPEGVSKSFKEAKLLQNALLSGTLLNALWEEFVSGFISSDAVSVEHSQRVTQPQPVVPPPQAPPPQPHRRLLQGTTQLSGPQGPQSVDERQAMAGDLNHHMQGMNIRDQTAQYQTRRSWNDVFDNKNLVQLSKEIGPREWRLVGSSLNFSRAQLDRFDADNYGQQQAVFSMLDSYRNGSSKYGTNEQIEELAKAFEDADLMNLACKVRGTERVTQPVPTAQPVAQPVVENLRTPTQESGHYYIHPGSSTQLQPPEFNYSKVTVSHWDDDQMYSKLSNDPDVYKMTSRPRGLAVVININKVYGFEDRRGSELDKSMMTSLFKELHFEVISHQDLTIEEIKSTLEKVANPSDKQTQDLVKNYDCLVVFLMSHGQKDEIFGSCGRVLQCKYLFDLFREDKCSLLRGKPKLFFIQACRGGMADPGVDGAREGAGSIKADGPEVSNYVTQPETANMLVAYSSVEGYKSYRHTTIGSWFVCEICEVFSKYAKELHVLDLLTKVNAGVANKMPAPKQKMFDPTTKSVSLVYKQCPEPKFTLTKRLFFFPGR